MNRPSPEKIDLTENLSRIIREITESVPGFSHIDPSKTLVCLSTNRAGSGGCTFAKVVPSRFKGGAEKILHYGRWFRIPPVIYNGIEQKYIIYFYMPRFFNLPPEEKLRVIFHELYHISPDFNGDIRRLGEVKAAHGHSKKHYDSQFENEKDLFHEKIKGTTMYRFLEYSSSDLMNKFSDIVALRLKVPKPVQVKR